MRAFGLIGAACLVLTGVRVVPLPSSVAEAVEGLQSAALLALAVGVIWHDAGRRWGRAIAIGAAGYLIALALEISSVHTGFPFGTFTHHTPGPRMADVPAVAPLAYVVYGALAWTLARRLVSGRVAQVPLGALLLTGWDLSYDAIGSTVLDRYTYAHPGGFMGVPVSNFAGWLLTSALILSAWSLLTPTPSPTGSPYDGRRGRLVAAVWGVLWLPALGEWLRDDETLLHRGDLTFVTANVYGASAVVGLLVLGIPALIAWSATSAGTSLPSDQGSGRQ